MWAVVIVSRHPTWWHSWHRDFMLIGIAVMIVGSLLGVLAVKKPGWIRWTVIPVILLVLWIGLRFIYAALAY
jgi:predicted membrane channel-forming protein YqfA (hemolysin III family)